MHSNSKRIFIALTLIVGVSVGYYSYRRLHNPVELVSFKRARQEFEQSHDQQLFEKRKQQLVDYYTSSAYEQDVEKICTQALKHFKTVPVTPQSIIIFDKDDTALYHYQVQDDLEFIWSRQPKLTAARAEGDRDFMDPVIEPVLKFYNQLKTLGFKLVFLTSRNEGDYEHCLQELIEAGYTGFEKLMLMPDNLAFDASVKTADWKLSLRKELAQQYTIVGCVGDRDADFEGGYTGYIVKLPNYLS